MFLYMGLFQLKIFDASVIIQRENTKELHSGICFDFSLICVMVCFAVICVFQQQHKDLWCP